MTEAEVLHRMADIVPPAAPEGWPFLVTVALGLGVGAGTWWLYRYLRMHKRTRQISEIHPHVHAHTKLAELTAQWRAGTITDREAAYRLAAVLRLGLGLAQLEPQAAHPAVADRQAWAETLGLLHWLRYQPGAQDRLDTETFERAAAWLAAGRDLKKVGYDDAGNSKRFHEHAT